MHTHCSPLIGFNTCDIHHIPLYNRSNLMTLPQWLWHMLTLMSLADQIYVISPKLTTDQQPYLMILPLLIATMTMACVDADLVTTMVVQAHIIPPNLTRLTQVEHLKWYSNDYIAIQQGLKLVIYMSYHFQYTIWKCCNLMHQLLVW